MRKGIDKDNRLEQILRLREYQQNNARDVNVMAGIISPDGGYPDNQTDGQDKDQTELPGKIYGKLRLVLCLLLFGAVCMYHFAIEPKEGTFTNKLKATIQTDYSDEIIELVNNIII